MGDSSSSSAAMSAALEAKTRDPTAHVADVSQIVDYFVFNYYSLMTKEPEKLSLFYSDKSKMSYTVDAGNKLQKEAYGKEEIGGLLLSLDLKSSSINITSMDYQVSIGESILIFILGDINKSELTIRFVQVFLLAQQPNGYYVHNDCIRYTQLFDREPAGIQSPPPKEPKHSQVLEKGALRHPNNEDSSTKEREDSGKSSEPPIGNGNKYREREDKSSPSSPRSPLSSWASLGTRQLDKRPVDKNGIKAFKPQGKTSSDSVPTLEKAHLGGPPPPHSTFGTGSANTKLSVFVKGLLGPLSVGELKPKLEEFGAVTYIDIDLAKKHVFVNFENEKNVSNAIGKTVSINGMKLKIEPRIFRKDGKESHVKKEPPRPTDDGKEKHHKRHPSRHVSTKK